MDNTCSKLNRANGKISKLRHFLPTKLYISVYYSIFYYSRLLYGCLVWSHVKQNNINCISRLQKHVRIFFSDFNDHTNVLFFELELLNITYIFKMKKVIFMFDFINDK